MQSRSRQNGNHSCPSSWAPVPMKMTGMRSLSIRRAGPTCPPTRRIGHRSAPTSNSVYHLSFATMTKLHPSCFSYRCGRTERPWSYSPRVHTPQPLPLRVRASMGLDSLQSENGNDCPILLRDLQRNPSLSLTPSRRRDNMFIPYVFALRYSLFLWV